MYFICYYLVIKFSSLNFGSYARTSHQSCIFVHPLLNPQIMGPANFHCAQQQFLLNLRHWVPQPFWLLKDTSELAWNVKMALIYRSAQFIFNPIRTARRRAINAANWPINNDSLCSDREIHDLHYLSQCLFTAHCWVVSYQNEAYGYSFTLWGKNSPVSQYYSPLHHYRYK